MQILHPTLSLYFISTGITKTTTSLVQDSINITQQMYNDLHSSSNSCSLQIRADDNSLIEAIIKDDSDIKATLTDGSTPLFTGILSNEHTWRVSTTGEDVFQVKIEDIGTRYLNKPLVDDDDTCIKDTLQNVVTTIATRCSISTITFDSSVTSAIKNKELINKVSSSMTCKDALDAICYEFGLVYYFNESGALVIKKTGALNGSPSTTIATTGTYDHYLYEDNKVGVDLTRKSRQYSQAKVQYSTISDSVNAVPIYAVTEKIEVPASEWWDGATHTDNIYEYTLDEFFVADKKYYTFNGTTYVEATVYPEDDPDPSHTPKVGGRVDDNTYYEYAGTASLIDMVDSTNGKDILYVYSDSIIPNLKDQTSQYPGYVERVAEPLDSSRWTLKQHKNTTKMEVLIDNTQGGLTSIYTLFQAKGRIIRKQGTSNIYRSLIGLTANSEVQFNYESQWIHNKNDAIALCEMLSNYYLYCDNTYTFYCKDSLDLGSIVRVYENLYSGLDVNMLLTAKQYTGYRNTEGLYKYTAQGISAFNLDLNIRAENYEVPTGISSLVSTSTSYALDDQGTDPEAVTGWQSTIPTGVAGDYLWTRTEYVYSSGQTVYEYSVSFIAGEAYNFKLYSRPSNIVANRRRTDTQEIYISTTVEGYTGTPIIKYWYSDGDPDNPYIITAEAATVFLPYDHSHPSLIVTAELAGAPTQRLELITIDETEEYVYYGELDIDTSEFYDASGQIIPSQYDQIDWTVVDDLLEANEQFLEGDSFFNNHTEPGFTDVYIYVYQIGQWIPIQASNLSNSVKSAICMKAQKDVLSSIEAGSVTKSDFGYFNTIIAGTVTADYIGGKEIEVHDGGFIYAGDVDIDQPAGQRVGQTGAGFCFDSLGNAEMANIRITGDSTIEGGSTVLGTLINYDVNGAPVFRTVKETNTRVSMSGSKTDGTNAPNAYLWSSFTSWLKDFIELRAEDGSYYSASGTIYARWNGSSLSSNSIAGIRYWNTVPTTGTSFTINGDKGAGTVETKTMYVNNNAYNMVFSELSMHPKTDQSIWGVTGYGELKVTTYTSGGSVYQTLCNQGEIEGNYGAGMAYAHNVVVPPGGYIVAEAGTYSGHPWGHWDSDLYIKFTWSESDMFYDGINFVLPNGSIYAFNSIMPTESSFSTYQQSLTCSSISLSLSMTMSASSSWPVEKYYRFSYTQSPGVSATVTTSIFDSQSFTYRGVSRTIASITFNNSMLKIIDTNGIAYEFYTASGYYYPRHSFSIVTLGEELGAYMRAVLPTDDSALDHNIGASTLYDSGNSQRWDTGFFTSLDVSQGIFARTINSGWIVPIITANYTITDDFEIGAMRPYFINSSGTISLTMPGDSSQRYIVLENNVVVMALVSAGKVNRYEALNGGASLSLSVTSSAEPYLMVYVLRIQ